MARSPLTSARVLILLAGSFLAGCGSMASPPPSGAGNASPGMTPSAVAFAPVGETLTPATEAAAARWGAAAGIAVSVAPEGTEGAVEVTRALSLPAGDEGQEAWGWTSGDGRLVLITQRARGERLERTLAHEMCHVLGVGPEHVPGDGVCGGTGHGPLIDAAALEAVCAHVACSAFNPE